MEMSVPFGETSTREGQDCTPTAENICMSLSFTTGCWMRYRAMASRMLALSFSFSNLWGWGGGSVMCGYRGKRDRVDSISIDHMCAYMPSQQSVCCTHARTWPSVRPRRRRARPCTSAPAPPASGARACSCCHGGGGIGRCIYQKMWGQKMRGSVRTRQQGDVGDASANVRIRKKKITYMQQ